MGCTLPTKQEKINVSPKNLQATNYQTNQNPLTKREFLEQSKIHTAHHQNQKFPQSRLPEISNMLKINQNHGDLPQQLPDRSILTKKKSSPKGKAKEIKQIALSNFNPKKKPHMNEFINIPEMVQQNSLELVSRESQVTHNLVGLTPISSAPSIIEQISLYDQTDVILLNKYFSSTHQRIPKQSNPDLSFYNFKIIRIQISGL